MITIEMKIELFSKMVKEKALSEPKKILEALNIKHAQLLDKMESSRENSRAVLLQEIEAKALEDKRKVLAKTQSEVQNGVLKKKNVLFQELKQSLEEEVKQAVISPNYELYFKEKLAKAMENFSNSDALIIGVHSKDVAFLPKGSSIETNDTLLGGFYILRNGNERYDFTLNSEVDALDAYLGCMLNTLFETNGEACEDEK